MVPACWYGTVSVMMLVKAIGQVEGRVHCCHSLITILFFHSYFAGQAYILMTYVAMAYTLMAYTVMAYTVMACAVMACTVMA